MPGPDPGLEFKVAFEEADKIGATIVLGGARGCLLSTSPLSLSHFLQ